VWANTNKERDETLPKAQSRVGSRDSPKIKEQRHRASNDAASDQEAQPKEKSNATPSKAKVVTNEMNRDNGGRPSGVGSPYFTELNLDKKKETPRTK
jgi:hypothetical protein